MAKNKEKIPIMSSDEERYMAFEGLLQWTHAVIVQYERISVALNIQRSAIIAEKYRQDRVRLSVSSVHMDCHFFAISANKLMEFLNWVRAFGLCQTVDFSEIDAFSTDDIRDLRNMREHVVDYFSGLGNARDRWMVKTTEWHADASSLGGEIIGGRLNWVKFGEAARKLLPNLLMEPIPYPEIR